MPLTTATDNNSDFFFFFFFFFFLIFSSFFFFFFFFFSEKIWLEISSEALPCKSSARQVIHMNVDLFLSEK